VNLPVDRAVAYLRALSASLDALAPHDDHVPLREAQDHLAALSPGLGGELLFPAEVSDRTGMPSFPWLDRARAEAVLARRSSEGPSEAELQRAQGLDPGLGQRLRARRDLHRHLRTAHLLPALRTTGAVRRLQPLDVALRYDRQAPDGRWLALRIELRLRGSTEALRVDDDGRLTVGDAVQHFLTRHFADRLDALVLQLGEAFEGEVRRLARSWVGPFWFPGVALPAGVDPSLGRGLLLHASTEVAATDIDGSVHRDPLLGPGDDQLPEALGVFRERRFAATGAVAGAAERWAAERGCPGAVVGVRARARRL
jgi:hypothetical protein